MSNHRSKCARSHSMTPVTIDQCESRTKWNSIFHQYPGYIIQLSLCSAECEYKVPLPQNTFHTGHIFRTRLHPQKGLQGNLFRTSKVHDNHDIFSSSEWGTRGDTPSGMTCCISSTSDLSCRSYVLISIVFELY